MFLYSVLVLSLKSFYAWKIKYAYITNASDKITLSNGKNSVKRHYALTRTPLRTDPLS